jgi:hypothetical protein
MLLVSKSTYTLFALGPWFLGQPSRAWVGVFLVLLCTVFCTFVDVIGACVGGSSNPSSDPSSDPSRVSN